MSASDPHPGGERLRRWLVVLALCCGACSPSPAPWFREEAAVRGVDFMHRSGHVERHLLPEIMAGGVALVDVDGDDDLDLYLVQSGRIGAPEADSANRLYLNRGDGHFDPARDLGDAADRGYGMGVAAGDYDNDGDTDLYVTNLGANTLLRNDGRGRFQDVTRQAAVGDPGWGTAAAFLDLDLDGHLDLFVVNYINWTPAIEQDCSATALHPTYCGPNVYQAPAMDRLYRNNGDGTFVDATHAAGLNVVFGNGLGAVGADFDGDGDTDVFVANDTMLNQLWLNQGAMRFTDGCLKWGCAVDEHGIAKAGMGVAAADFDDDGDSDLLVVNLERQTDSLFRNEGAYFVDATRSAGLSAPSMRHTRFGVALADFDNDGLLDLYEANGKVQLSAPAVGDGYAEPNTLFRGVREPSAGAARERAAREGPARRTKNPGGFRLVEIARPDGAPPALVHTSRGVAVGDIDGDGGLDLVVANRDAAPYVLMNQASRGGWARFRVVSRHGSDVPAATVVASVGQARRRRDVQPAASYLASSSPRAHFGLGEHARAVDVVVIWPGGVREAFGDFAAGRTYTLREGDGTPR